MKVLFTTNDKWGSRFIRWCTGEEVSHVAVLLDNNFVLHSTMASAGVSFTWYPVFLEKNRVVAQVTIPSDNSLERRLCALDAEGYDWTLLFTMGLRRLGLPVPLVDNPYRDLCTELVTEHVLHTTDKLTPGQLLERMENR